MTKRPTTLGERSLTVRHDRGEYAVKVGQGALNPGALSPAVDGRRVFVVTSAPVRQLHGRQLDNSLAAAAAVDWLEVPDGEAAKNIATAQTLWDRMLEGGGKRDSLVIAFGGGSVGDVAGFVAASFLRGVDFLQIPTTLLAQVDAAVGGKVAIDLSGGKNTVGAFHQPLLVLADVDLLGTLSQRDLASGLAESLKMGVVLSLPLLELIEGSMPALVAAEPESLAAVVAKSVAVKAAVVEKDPFEQDRRRLLNFGHTLGHAIEVCLGYQTLRHGEAVAWGMLFACRLSRLKGLGGKEAERVESAVRGLSLPPLPRLQVDDLLKACARDKKATERGLAWVLCQELGQGVISDDFEPGLLADQLGGFLGQNSR